MTIEPISTPFASGGFKDDTATLDTWAPSGWVDEVVRYRALNAVLARSDNKINELVVQSNENETGIQGPSGIDDDAYLSGVFGSDAIMHGRDTGNFLAAGSAYGTSVRSCTWTKIGGSEKILSIGQTGSTAQVNIYDVATMAYTTTIDVTSIAGLTGFYPMDLCADGARCYIVFYNPTSHAHVLYAFSMTGSWSVAPGWSGGVSLDTGSAWTAEKCIGVADDDHVWVIQHWLSLSGSSTDACVIIRKSNATVIGEGHGDAGTLVSGRVIHATSDGEYIYMGIYHNTNKYIVASMSITSPGSTGCGWTNVPASSPLTMPAVDSATGIAVCGETIVSTFLDSSSSTIIAKYRKTKGYVGYATTSDTSTLKGLTSITTDGVDFWAVGMRVLKGAGSTDVLSLCRIDLANMMSDTDVEVFAGGEDMIPHYSSWNTGLVVGFFDFRPFRLAISRDSIYHNFAPSGTNLHRVARFRRHWLR